MRDKQVAVWFSAALLVLLSSCAVFTHGTTQIIPVSSTPSGAEIFIDGESQGFTPAELELGRGKSHELTLKLGTQTQTIVLKNVPEAGTIALDAAPAGVAGGLTLFTCVRASQEDDPFLPLFCSGGFLITVLAGTPLYVDALTGAWYRLVPESVSVQFE